MLRRDTIEEALADGQAWADATGIQYDVVASGKGFKAVQRRYAHKHGKPVLATTFSTVKGKAASIPVEMFKEFNFSELGKMFGISRATVARHAHAVGIKGKQVKEIKIDLEWLREQLKTRSVKDVAEELGVRAALINDRCREHGIPRLVATKRAPRKRRRIDPTHLRLMLAHMTVRQYSEKFGFHRTYVYNVCREHNIDLKGV